jgi:transposase
MTEEARRTFSREYKVAAVRRMLAGEPVSALARELGVRPKYLYQWRERFRMGGAIALRSRGRPTRAEVLAMQAPSEDERAAGGVASPGPMPAAAAPDELAKAQRRIAALERKIGQQQLDLDFFQQALRHVRDLRRRRGAPGGTGSTRSSKR